MSWDIQRTYRMDLSDAGQSVLLQRSSDGALSDLTRKLKWVLSDHFGLNLIFHDREAGNDSIALDAGSTVIVSGKVTADLDDEDADTLFAADGFVASTVGSGDTAYTKYSAALNLNTPEARACFPEGKNEVAVTVDVEIRNAGNTRRLTRQFEITLRRQAYDGETSPAASAPYVYTATQMDALFVRAVPTNANFRFFGGRTFQSLNPATGLFHTLIAGEVDGRIQPVMDQSGMAADAVVDPDTPPGINLRFYEGKTAQLLNPNSNLWHTMRPLLVDGKLIIVLDQNGME